MSSGGLAGRSSAVRVDWHSSASLVPPGIIKNHHFLDYFFLILDWSLHTLSPSHLQALVAPLAGSLQVLELLRGRVQGGGGVLICAAVRGVPHGAEALQGPLLLLEQLELLLLLIFHLQQPGEERQGLKSNGFKCFCSLDWFSNCQNTDVPAG